MTAYILRRFLLAFLTVAVISFAVFAAIRVVPGKAVDLLLQNTGRPTPEQRAALEDELGLDEPMLTQYGDWVGGLVQGDLGKSLYSDAPVGPDIKRYLPVTLELGLMSMLMSTVMGVTIGVISAFKQDSIVDYITRSVAIGMLSVPGYWLATIIIAYGAVYFAWTPPLIYVPFTEDPIANLKQFWLPALLMSFATAGTLMRLTRTAMLEVLRQDYVRTARAKGLRERIVVQRHALRNAMIPVITMVGIYLGYTLSSTVIFEQIFALPGIGRYLLQSIHARDYPVVQALAILVALVVTLVNLSVDIAYGYLDPRIRYN